MFQKIICVALVLVSGTYFLTSTPAQDQDVDREPPASWRHLALSSQDLNDKQIAKNINELGTDGWELVDVENFESKGETFKTVYYFKKPGQ